jgi:hypothetical protein
MRSREATYLEARQGVRLCAALQTNIRRHPQAIVPLTHAAPHEVDADRGPAKPVGRRVLAQLLEERGVEQTWSL